MGILMYVHDVNFPHRTVNIWHRSIQIKSIIMTNIPILYCYKYIRYGQFNDEKKRQIIPKVSLRLR